MNIDKKRDKGFALQVDGSASYSSDCERISNRRDALSSHGSLCDLSVLSV
jgi:hypothetical protein